jgi:hypothetical protein
MPFSIYKRRKTAISGGFSRFLALGVLIDTIPKM